MFKHYLTYHFAVSFTETCATTTLPIPVQSELQRCAQAMLNQFARSLQTQDALEKSKCLFVALTYLRDCGDILKTAELTSPQREEFFSKYEILNLRFEHLCLEASQCEGGQLRMFG